MQLKPNNLYLFGPFQLDAGQRLLFRGGEIVPLRPKATDTLLVLVENRGQLLTKEELLGRVWPDSFVEEVTLAKTISTLRKTLGDSPAGQPYIETHSKRGYRFVAEVQEVEGEPATKQAIVSDPVPETAVPRRRVMWTWLTVLPLLAILPVGLWYFFRSQERLPERKVMLAVLPFENLSGDPEQEYFSNGLTEEMITALGQLNPERLGVIARTSAMQYKGARKNARQIADELGVDYILEGSVRREGARVRITAQLIQAGDQSHLWAENYDRDLRDVLSLQSEVAGSIAQQIRLRLSPEQDARLKITHPLNPDAYENYLKGRFFWNKRTVEGHGKAIEYFAKAIALDPNYAQAYAGMADAYALLGSAHDLLPRSEAMMRAREAAKTALGLDETLADAHTSLAFVTMHYDWDFAAAEKEFRRAIALNPGYATAHHWYAYNLVALGRLEDAIAEIRLAQKADPLSVIISRDVGEMLLFAGRDDEAIAQSLKTLEMDPNFDGAHLVLAWAYHRKGRSREFIEELEKSGNTGLTLGLSALVLALKGRREEAERLLPAFEKHLTPLEATVYAYLGDKDRAFASLEKVFANRDGGLIVMRVAPDLEPLRSDPRFERLARRVGLPNIVVVEAKQPPAPPLQQ